MQKYYKTVESMREMGYECHSAGEGGWTEKRQRVQLERCAVTLLAAARTFEELLKELENEEDDRK